MKGFHGLAPDEKVEERGERGRLSPLENHLDSDVEGDVGPSFFGRPLLSVRPPMGGLPIFIAKNIDGVIVKSALFF